jgi:DNA polymerase-1
MYVVIDIETEGLSRFKDKINLIGVYVPDYDYYGIFYNKKQLVDFLMKLPKDVEFVFQNGKFDTLFILQEYGIDIPIHHDVMLLSYVLDMGEPKSLKYLVEKHFNQGSWDISVEAKTSITNETIEYLKLDVYWTYMLFDKLYNQLDEVSLKLYHKLVIPSFNAYKYIEYNGIQLDMERLESTLKEYETKRDFYNTKLNNIKGINWNSSKQLGAYLYGELYLPILDRTEKGEPSVSAPVLRKLSKHGYEIANDILEFKYYNNAINTFLSRWKNDAIGGRLYPRFNIDATKTGRTSCVEPNLQQVPRRKELRSLFTARKGYVLLEADQSQVELRIAAHYAKEDKMIEVYIQDGDIHTETAKSIAMTDNPTKQDRIKAKPVNFGFLYGMQAKKFPIYAEDNYDVNYTLDEAVAYRDRFFNTYPKLLSWYELQKEECRMTGGVSTLFGRFRRIPEIYSANFWEKLSAERISINTPVQSTASDILLAGMIEIVENLKECYVVGTVHDSILIEVPEDKAEYYVTRIKEIMSSPKLLQEFNINLLVPLKVDAELGNWGTK